MIQDLAVDYAMRVSFEASQDFFQGRGYQAHACRMSAEIGVLGIDPGPFQPIWIEFEVQAIFLRQELGEIRKRQDFHMKGRLRSQCPHRRHVGRLDGLGILHRWRERLGLLLGGEGMAGRQDKTGDDGSESRVPTQDSLPPPAKTQKPR